MCCEAICLREGRIESLILVEARYTVSLATRHRWFLRDISVVAANCSELVCLVIAAKRESNLLPSIKHLFRTVIFQTRWKDKSRKIFDISAMKLKFTPSRTWKLTSFETITSWTSSHLVRLFWLLRSHDITLSSIRLHMHPLILFSFFFFLQSSRLLKHQRTLISL